MRRLTKREKSGFADVGQSLPKPVRTRILRIVTNPHLFAKIFNTDSPSEVLKILLRLRSLKQRFEFRQPGARTVGTWLINIPLPLRKPSKLTRDFHHLTPNARKSEPYYGNSPTNKLLIKIERHKAWHRAFDLLTLEEVIDLVVEVIEFGWVAKSIEVEIGGNPVFLQGGHRAHHEEMVGVACCDHGHLQQETSAARRNHGRFQRALHAHRDHGRFLRQQAQVSRH